MDADLEKLLVTARELRLTDGDADGLRRAAARGRLVRPHRGSYLATGQWNRLTELDRYTVRIIGAITAGRENPIVSHLSAAVLWGAPVIGPLPSLVHVLATPEAGTRTEHGFRKHATAHRYDLERRGELRMTSLARTLADVSVDAPFLTAVGILDWAFARHPVDRADVVRVLDRLEVKRGRKKAERAIAFADARSGSPGETLSRVRIHEAGFPAPALQHPFSDARGLIGLVDFWWPEHGLVGEFDGVAKYIREEYTQGTDPAGIVIAEKLREDRIRSRGPRVARWDWSTAWPPYRLSAQLLAAGLPSVQRRYRTA
jgi:hypothetical protein